MLKIDKDALIQAVSQSLETMAFMSLSPNDSIPEQVDDRITVGIDFRGQREGTIRLCTSRSLGRAIVANMNCTDPAECSSAEAEDAVREVANISAGRLLREAGDNILLELPTIEQGCADNGWKSFVMSKQAVVVDVEGIPLGLMLLVTS